MIGREKENSDSSMLLMLLADDKGKEEERASKGSRDRDNLHVSKIQSPRSSFFSSAGPTISSLSLSERSGTAGGTIALSRPRMKRCKSNEREAVRKGLLSLEYQDLSNGSSLLYVSFCQKLTSTNNHKLAFFPRIHT